MRIITLKLTGFKGADVSHDLSPLNLFTGANGSGKTRVIQAVEFAVQGKTSLGGKPEHTAQLASTAGCAVRTTLDDAFEWVRAIHCDARTQSLSTAAEVRGRDGLSLKDADAAIRAHVGAFAPALDLSTFTSLSQDKKRAFVLDLCARAAGGEIDADAICTRINVELLKRHRDIGEGTVSLARDHAESDYDVVDRLYDRLSARYRECVNSVMTHVHAEIKGELTAAIGAAVAKARDIKNAATAAKDKSHAASQELSKRKAEIVVAAGGIAIMREELTAIERDREDIITQIAHQEGRASARQNALDIIQSRNRQRDTLCKSLKHNKGDTGPSADDAAELDSQADHIEKLHAIVDDEGLEQARRDHEAAQEAYTWAIRDTETRSGALGLLRVDLSILQKRLVAAKGDVFRRALGLLANMVAAVPNLAGSPDVTKLRALLTAHAGADAGADDPKVAQASITALDSNIAKDERVLNTAKEAVLEAEKIAGECNVTFERLREAYTARMRGRNDSLAEAKQLRDRATEIRRRVAELQTQAENANTAIKNCDTEIVRLESELNNLDSDGGFVPLDELIPQQDRLKALIEEAKARIDAKIRYDSIDTELTNCIEAAERHRSMYDAASAVLEAIKVLREELIEELVRPLKKHIQRFLFHDPDHVVYLDLTNANDKPTFDLGWIVDGKHKHAMDALSGGEAAIYSAALTYALVQLANPPLKLLLIEAGECDMPHLMVLLDAIERVGGDIDNAMVTTHLPVEVVTGGWNLVKLATQELAAVA